MLSKNITGATPGEFPVLFCECAGEATMKRKQISKIRGGDLRELQYIDLLQFVPKSPTVVRSGGSAVVLLASEIRKPIHPQDGRESS